MNCVIIIERRRSNHVGLGGINAALGFLYRLPVVHEQVNIRRLIVGRIHEVQVYSVYVCI